MSKDAFNSSDSARSAKPLRHARHAKLPGALPLELGGELSDITVCYETYGTLAPDGGNAVLVCHALSGDSHVAPHDAGDDPGWWDIAVGPGKPIDTDRYFVICPNLLGGCRGTTGPNSVNPRTGRPYGPDFPSITIADMADVQRRLVEHLGIRQLLAVIGGSMGGHLVQAWAVRHSDVCRGAIALATASRVTTQSLAFDVVGRNAILHDPNFHGGRYYGKGPGPHIGLAIARMIGHITYLSGEAMKQKFGADRYQPRDVPTTFETAFSVGSYLGYQGHKFVERFDANSYILLTKAMDLFDLGDSPEALVRAYSPSRCRWLVMSFTSDWLFPTRETRAVVHALNAVAANVSFVEVDSDKGHDAFLLEDPRYHGLLRATFDRIAAGLASCM